MNIRIMTISDFEKVHTLWMNTKGMGLNNIDDTRDGIEKFLKRNPNTCYVCEKDDNIIGVILCGHDGRRGYIYHFAVAENERNQGIGTKLLESAINSLKSEGISKTAFVVFEKNEIGNAFWERKGFTSRDDLIYRNKNIAEIERIDT